MRPNYDASVGDPTMLAEYLLGPVIVPEDRINRRDCALGLAHALLQATGETDLADAVSERLADVTERGKTTRRPVSAKAGDCSN